MPVQRIRGAVGFLLANSLFLIGGSVAGLIWANLHTEKVNHETYEHFLEFELVRNEQIGYPNQVGTVVGGADGRVRIEVAGHTHWKPEVGTIVVLRRQGAEDINLEIESVDEAAGTFTGVVAGESGAEVPTESGAAVFFQRVVNLHYLINDILMALFFAIAGKEVWEALLPGGPLNDPRKAATPLIATLGGMVGPAALYLLGCYAIGRLEDFANGWAIPCATDIAFSYLVARIVFGNGHPAISFLLLLAIADDALGLIILAVFYPTEEVRILWMLLPVAAIVIGLVLRKIKIASFWPYLLIPGVISWIGFAKAGLHPALGLLPMIPTMPHAHTDLGIFMRGEEGRHDTLNEFEHWFKNPVEVILGLFGLMNAGVVLSAIGAPTYLVLIGLLIGKPLGIFGFGMLAAVGLGFGLPEGMNRRDLFVLGCAAAIGFTVALFVSTVAFPKGPIQDAAKMGALLSFGGAIVTYAAGKILRIEKARDPAPKAADAAH